MLESVSTILDAYNAVLNGGFQRITPVANGIAYSMAAISLMFAAYNVMFHKPSMIGIAFKYVVLSAFYMLCINNVQDIGEGITRGAVQLGLTASGSKDRKSTR